MHDNWFCCSLIGFQPRHAKINTAPAASVVKNEQSRRHFYGRIKIPNEDQRIHTLKRALFPLQSFRACLHFLWSFVQMLITVQTSSTAVILILAAVVILDKPWQKNLHNLCPKHVRQQQTTVFVINDARFDLYYICSTKMCTFLPTNSNNEKWDV